MPDDTFHQQRLLMIGCKRLACALLASTLLFLLVACGSTAAKTSGTPTPGQIQPVVTITPTPSAPTATTPLITYSGHLGPVIGVSWSPDNTKIASCGNDGTVQVWDAHTGTVLWKVKIGRYAFAVAWSPDGQKIAGGAGDGSVVVLLASNGQQLAAYTRQNGAIEGLAWSPNSSLLVAGSQDGTADVWNVQNNTFLFAYKGHTSAVERVAWSPDGKSIASASDDGTVQVWNASTGQHQLTYRGNNAPVWSVAWSPDSKRIVSGTGAAGAYQPVETHNSVQVWDASSGQTLLTYTGTNTQSETYALAWSPDGKSIASGGDDFTVHIWDASSGRDLFHFSGHHDIVFALAWSPNNKFIASASVDGTAQVWQPQI